MRMYLTKSEYVCGKNPFFSLMVEIKHYRLGISIEERIIRINIIFWQIGIHYKINSL